MISRWAAAASVAVLAVLAESGETVGQTRGGPAGAAYDEAIARQRSELARANDAARQGGCTGFFGSASRPGCGELMSTVGRMQSNLSTMEQRRPRTAPTLSAPPPIDQGQVYTQRSYPPNGFAPGSARGSYYPPGAYAPGGPVSGRAAYGPQPYPPRPTGFFGLLFGGNQQWEPPPPAEDRYEDRGGGNGPVAPGGGSYRTLCVRLCDGYYFPISFSSPRSRFPIDDKVCQSLYPGAKVALYVHHSQSEESDDMVSLTGEPYTRLPNAFAYRTSFNPQCSTRIGLAYGAAVVGGPAGSPVAAAPLVPVPLAKPEPSTDPETLANDAGDFLPKLIKDRGGAVVAGNVPATPGPIRTIGPAYYYAVP